MKLSLAVVAFFLPCLSLYAGELASARLRSPQTISVAGGRQESGFLQYVGQHRGREVIALSVDIGSSIPTQDLRLYVRVDDSYRLLINIPLLARHGFRCSASSDILSIFFTGSRDILGRHSKEGGKAFITIDLDALVLATSKA